MMLAGISAKPIPIVNTTKIPLMLAAVSFNFLVTGKGELTTLKTKSGFPVAYLRIDSYINYGNSVVASYDVAFTNVANLKFLVRLFAS